MITKYKARKTTFGTLIEKVQVEKETDKCVWIKGRRNNKRSDYENFFDTFDEAKTFLTIYANDKLIAARQALESAQGFAGNVKGLKEL